MAGINRCTFIGNLGRDPEMRSFPNGDAVCNVSIGVSETWKDKNTGERKEKTEWVPLVFTRKLAEIAGQYLRKGAKVYVEGKMQTRKWEKDGIDRYTTEIMVTEMQMLDGKKDGAARSGAAPADSAAAAFDDDDIGF